MELLTNLNDMQKKAVQKTEGPLLLFAGAGSGKTRVLAYRIAHLIESGISPHSILALTFTNKAAGEMKERVASLAKNGDRVWVSTFHSTCVRFLRNDIDKLGYDKKFTIYDADDSERLMKQCLKELDISDKLFPVKSLLATIGGYKDNLLTPSQVTSAAGSEYRQQQIAKIYEYYQKKLRMNNALDFDDLIFFTVQLFRANPNILEQYQERFKYILVDEYQDTSVSQYKLVYMLASKYENICVVGDDDQSIYGWRGANIGNILGFEKDFPSAEIIKLEQNYRSTQTILNTANAVISNNFTRKAKELWTKNPEGDLIEFFKADTDTEEGVFVAETVAAGVKSGRKYSDYAVLYRNNSISRSIEEQLILKNIPYRLFGGVQFYQRKEVKDILAYLKCIYNPDDSMSLLRIINVPKRGIGATTIEKVAVYAAENDLSLFDALIKCDEITELGNRSKNIKEFAKLMQGFIELAKSSEVAPIIQKILNDTKYFDEFDPKDVQDGGRIENVNELLGKALAYDENTDTPSLEAFLEEVSLVADIDNMVDSDNMVSLMTLHCAKGLEFPVVFIVGFEEGIFPGYRSVSSGTIKELEEERRLCYVGITRAEEQLYLSAANSRLQYGQIVHNAPSRFLKEIPAGHVSGIQAPAAKTTAKPKSERTGISQFAEINKSRDSIAGSFGGKNYAASKPMPAPKNKSLDFEIGDNVRQMKYGVGIVKDIKPAGADFEVTVSFPDMPDKKFMAHLSKLKKVD